MESSEISNNYREISHYNIDVINCTLFFNCVSTEEGSLTVLGVLCLLKFLFVLAQDLFVVHPLRLLDQIRHKHVNVVESLQECIYNATNNFVQPVILLHIIYARLCLFILSHGFNFRIIIVYGLKKIIFN